MKHDKIKRLIQEYLDNEINDQEKRLLFEHINQCPACNQEFRALSNIDSALRLLPEFYPGAGFNQRVMNALGYSKIIVWSKAGIAFAGAWLAGVIALLLSPIPGDFLNQTLTSIPALVRIFSKLELVVSSLGHVVLPFVRNSFDITWPVIGLIFSIIITYLFIKTLAMHSTLAITTKPSAKPSNSIG
jgi:hypothetical protein